MSILDRSESRDGYAVRVLAVHTTEGGGTAQALRDAAWWVGSAHAIADKAGALLTPAQGCVPYDEASWTLRSGNRWSENIELIGYAKTTRAQWLEDQAQLNACARWLADRSKARGIPLVKLTPAEYRAGNWGVIGHHDHTVGYSDGTHWDPGPGFPWDVVLDKARAYAAGQTQEDDFMGMQLDARQEGLFAEFLENSATGRPGRKPGAAWDRLDATWKNSTALVGEVAALRAAVQGLAQAVGTKDDSVDVAALEAFISSEVDRAQEAFRDAITEGYDAEVVLTPKPGA